MIHKYTLHRRVLVFILWALTLPACLRSAGPTASVNETVPAQDVGPSVTMSLSPGATLTPGATRTAADVATLRAVSTSTPLPSPSATPQGQIGPFEYPPDVNPLTGLRVGDPAVLERRPLAIKISNFPDCVRPQDGLARADLVFEHYAEGGTTRFTAIYLSQGASQIGSVRSARLIDLEIPAMYHAMFAFSGASGGVKQRLEASDFVDWIISPDFEPGHPAFYRKPIDAVPCGLLEHTLFTGSDRLWQTTDERGLNTRQDLSGTTFNATRPDGGAPAEELTLRYTASYVYWRYHAGQGVYYRTNNGALHRDGLDDQPITAANVVAVFANHVTTDILEDMVGFNPTTGAGGNYSVEIQIWGDGPALLFRDGQGYEINWARWERFRPFAFTDALGHLAPLKPGVTWFQVVPLDTPVEQTAPAAWQLTPPRPSSGPSWLTPGA